MEPKGKIKCNLCQKVIAPTETCYNVDDGVYVCKDCWSYDDDFDFDSVDDYF